MDEDDDDTLCIRDGSTPVLCFSTSRNVFEM